MNTTTVHTIPTTSAPNSVIQELDDNGNLERERYYDENGRALFDIDYTNHGNAKKHPTVPHKHKWDWSDPKRPKRGKAE